MGLMDKIFGDLNTKEVKKLEKIVDQIEALDSKMQAMSNDELKAMTPALKERLAAGETLDDILPEAFAVAREASMRVLGMKPFRVQLIGGVALHQGRIAEMKTGEGKTLTATLPVYLNALAGEGVHVVTVNDYLAKRDCEWMGKLYTFLGLTVGCIIHEVPVQKRRAAYEADITYGTNNEFGFDYLRDNMVTYKEMLTQRPLNFAIVDEVDSILIDEARTPLIISGRGAKSSDQYAKADRFVKTLKEEEDFIIDEKEKGISLTEEGIAKCEKNYGLENFSDPDNMEINHHVMQALRARFVMKRDIDYIVKDGEIIIVDEFTGRLMYGRRYSNGLHQAIEAKERLVVKNESKTLATITLQNYFRMYKKLSGMTGTAKTEEDEFRDIYNMDVVEIPPNRPVARIDENDAVFPTTSGKYRAIADRVAEAHEKGQPVLVGTTSIEKSELLANLIKKRGVKNYNILNAKQHEKEAEIIAEAGRLGAVTIATNMAGRGTDIILGGNPEFEAKKELRKEGFSENAIEYSTTYIPSDDEEIMAARERFAVLHAKFKEERKEEQEKVRALGGLYIIGTERHESRRIDNQLRGRAGRQGDPGRTQFCISMEDDILRLFGGDRMKSFVDRMGMEDDEPIEVGMITKGIESAQKKVEAKNFGTRKYVLQFDNVMNKQREIIYDERRKVLFGENLREYVLHMAEEFIDAEIGPVVVASKFSEDWDYATLEDGLKKICARYEGLKYTDEEKKNLTEETLKEDIMADFEKLYAEKEEEIGEDRMREVERMILIRVVDNQWMDHIDAMDQLKSGIGLRSMGGTDPAAAYAQEGFDMFEAMISEIKETTVKFCYNATIKTDTRRKEVYGEGESRKDDFVDNQGNQISTGGAPVQNVQQVNRGPQKPKTVRRDQPKINRNAPCPCGSGKKYKHCCGREEQ